ncbi:MAG: TonB-dependent receptor [Chlorobiaceae bacterium]|nr:TonB-dependent receptor [Chlorobiaceae bacterium]
MKFSVTCIMTAMLMSVVLADVAIASGRGDETVVIGQADMASMQASDTPDLLNRIPGVNATETSVSIRGSYQVKVMVDGNSINDFTSYSGAVKWSMIPIERIEKIVVHKGRGGVAFGDNTEGGVIEITTRQSSRLGGTVDLHAGNHGEQNGEITLQGGLDRFSATVSAGARDNDGFTVNDDRKERHSGLRLDFKGDSGAKLFFSGDYSEQKKGLRGYPESRTPNSRQNYEDSSLLFGAEFDGLESRSWYRQTTTRNSDSDRDFFSQLRVFSAGQTLKRQVSLPLLGELRAGAGFEWQEAKGSSFSKRKEEQSWLLFSKQFAQSDGPWSAVAGIRGNLYSTFSNTVNPELGITWNSKPWKVELSAGGSSNLPTFRQRYNETSTTRSNPDLQMEKAVKTSLGVSFTPSDKLSCELSLFHRDITDRITYVRAADNTGRYENFGEVIYQGLESSLTWKPAAWLELTPSYLYLHARNEETGLWLPAIPFHTLSGQIVLKPFSRLSIRADLKYTGEVYARTDNVEKLPGYGLVDLRVEYRAGATQLYLDVDNLLDKEYLYVDGYDAPPREWEIGMNYTF